MHIHMEVRGQLERISSLLPPCGPGVQTQDIRNLLYPLSHLAIPLQYGFNLLPSGTFLKCPSSLYSDVKWYYGLNVSPKISWLGNVVSSTAMLGDLIC